MFPRPLLAREMSEALVQGAVAFLFTVLWGGWLVRFLRQRRIGKKIRQEGPERHQAKSGTPTMGGLMIVVTVVVVTLLFNLRGGRYSMLLPVGVILGCGILGATDDLFNLVGRKGQGLSARVKFAWLFAIALAAAWMLYSENYVGPTPTYVPFLSGVDLQSYLGLFYVPIAALIIAFFAHAVNLTDGLDGLSGSTAGLAFAAYGVIAFLQGQDYLLPFCFTVMGTLLSFLWYNAYPARVFMGDTGSLALGAGLGVVALMTWQWILLPIIGVVFVIEASSVILQVGYFKWTKRRYGEGRRIFRMTPLHHHFELLGWSEVQIVARLAIIGVIAAMVGVALALN
ncbi:MAG: phospho-N-acetylmuramoyl-pentapeptide-transferase [Chloroflexia bacterium]|nr:phospho-N-acetylmuramoyl-pentapeptide-transferase [Chloroflexia bacterium]